MNSSINTLIHQNTPKKDKLNLDVFDLLKNFSIEMRVDRISWNRFSYDFFLSWIHIGGAIIDDRSSEFAKISYIERLTNLNILNYSDKILQQLWEWYTYWSSMHQLVGRLWKEKVDTINIKYLGKYMLKQILGRLELLWYSKVTLCAYEFSEWFYDKVLKDFFKQGIIKWFVKWWQKEVCQLEEYKWIPYTINLE